MCSIVSLFHVACSACRLCCSFLKLKLLRIVGTEDAMPNWQSSKKWRALHREGEKWVWCMHGKTSHRFASEEAAATNLSAKLGIPLEALRKGKSGPCRPAARKQLPSGKCISILWHRVRLGWFYRLYQHRKPYLFSYRCGGHQICHNFHFQFHCWWDPGTASFGWGGN